MYSFFSVLIRSVFGRKKLVVKRAPKEWECQKSILRGDSEFSRKFPGANFLHSDNANCLEFERLWVKLRRIRNQFGKIEIHSPERGWAQPRAPTSTSRPLEENEEKVFTQQRLWRQGVVMYSPPTLPEALWIRKELIDLMTISTNYMWIEACII